MSYHYFIIQNDSLHIVAAIFVSSAHNSHSSLLYHVCRQANGTAHHLARFGLALINVDFGFWLLEPPNFILDCGGSFKFETYGKNQPFIR